MLRNGKRVHVGEVFASVAPSAASRPRVGLIIAKKVALRAIDRNRVRRQLRESFRLQKGLLPPLDIVLRLGNLPATRAELRAAIDRLWSLL